MIKNIEVSQTQRHKSEKRGMDMKARVVIQVKDIKGLDPAIKGHIRYMASCISSSLYTALLHSSESPTPEEKTKKLAEFYSGGLYSALH